MSVYIDRFRDLSRRAQAGLSALVLTFAAVAPVLITGSASAAPTLLSRNLTSTSARPSQTTQLEWTFNTTADTANADYIEIQFCDTPLTTCTTVNTPTIALSPTATLSGPWTSTGGTTTRENGLGGGSNNQIQFDKTTADDATSKTALKITLGASDIVNNTTPNKSYYTRMRIYSDTGTTLKWEGVFAQSTSQTLTVNARVQERLDFCVASTTVNTDTTTPGADCAAVTLAGTSSVDIGNIDSSATNVSPVSTTNGGSNTNAIAMIRTNAFNGASIAYHSLSETSSGSLKVPGATCTASPVSTSTTDQCFNTSASQGAFTVGISGEKFGMTIAGINGGSTSAYTCASGGSGCNMVRDGVYDGNGTGTFVTDSDQVGGTTNGGYAWDANPANTTTIATSTGSAVKVVDDEALILKFAALSGITTPTGAYTVQADFIATTTF